MSSRLDKAIKDFIQIIREAGNKGTSPLDAQAEVLRIDEDGTAWVHLPGGVDETPVKLTINAEVGDKVYVRLSGGRAWITGNQTAPPTDDKTAITAKSLANIAGNRAKTAQKTADQAQIAANSALKGTKENAAQMAQMVIDFNGDIENLQDQIDGNIATWFYDVDPDMGLPPVTDWDTDEKKDAHLGDIYYNTVKGYAWRFMKSGSTYSWERITDTDVTKALADAAKAQDTADSKRRVFYNTPTVPYDAGDLWVQGSGGDILRCAQAKTNTGSYDRNDWVLASKYTDDSALTTWIEGDFATTIQGLEEGLVDAKVETYYQTTDPSTGWSDTQKSEHKGDLWYNSTASVQKYYRWSGTAWQELTATPPQAVFDSIDKKATIYTGTTTPTNPSSGDLWFKGADEPILTYVNNSWVEYNKYTDDSTLNAWLTDTYAVDKTNLQNQIDGKAETWYQATDPSSDWSAADKPNHEGDLWYNTSDNTTWYYTGSAWSQQSIPTSVFNNINGKANIFVGSTAPENPKTGDLWLESASSDILTYVDGSWVKYNKYTDDTKADQAQADIDNLEIGGRNLLLNSGFKNNADEWFTYDITDYVVKDGRKCAHMNFSKFKVTNFVMQSILGKLEPDTQYTMSGWVLTENIVTGSTNFACMFYHDGYYDNNGTNNWYSYGDKWVPINAGKWTHLELAFTTDSTKLLNSTTSDMYLYARDMTGDIYFCDFKLEKGNKATDWTPAPEDVDAGIANAAKTATNYIHSDTTNGLVVNNNQNVGVGYDIQLKADGSNTGMNIRQNGNILASFLQNSVSLGKNSINSKVAMCGDKGGVSASFGYYIASVTSINGEPGSTLSFDFNETTFKNKVGQKTGFYDFSYTSADGWTLFDPVNDTSYAVTLSQYGITLRTPTSSLNDHAQIVINYVLDGSVKFYNADISNPVRKLELEMAENPSSSESDFANITIERQSGTYANGDGKEHSIITMMTLHEFANVATLQLFDDSISLDATHVHLTSTHGEGSIQLNGDTYINGIPIQGCHKIATSATGAAGSYTYNSLGWYMHSGQTAYLEEKISDQQNGIILVWSFYNGEVKDWGWNFTVIPKLFLTDNPGGSGMSTFMAENSALGNVGAKYIYVRDDRILGNDTNTKAGTGASAIKYNNNKFVLRWVYGF